MGPRSRRLHLPGLAAEHAKQRKNVRITYSTVEGVTLCFSETFEALAECFEHGPLAAGWRPLAATARSSLRVPAQAGAGRQPLIAAGDATVRQFPKCPVVAYDRPSRRGRIQCSSGGGPRLRERRYLGWVQDASPCGAGRFPALLGLVPMGMSVARSGSVFEATLLEPNQSTPGVSTAQLQQILLDASPIVLDPRPADQ